MAAVGDLGLIAIAKEPVVLNQQLHAFVCPNNVSNEYIAYFLSSQTNYMNSIASKTTIPYMNKANCESIPVLLPAYAEQLRIAEILSTWDRAIEVTEKLIANSEAQKKALMQKLLTGKERLPGFEGEWVWKRLDCISQRITRRNDGNQYPILTISSTKGFVRQDEKYNRYMAGRSVENYILLRRGEFAYNKGNSKTFEFGCVFDLRSHNEALVPHVYVCFALKQGYDAVFFRFLFEADYLRPQLGRVVNTGVRNNGLLNITPAEFLKCNVPTPPIDEQIAISQVLMKVTQSISKLDADLEALRAEKSALMQQLLTGKRRVKIDKEAAA